MAAFPRDNGMQGQWRAGSGHQRRDALRSPNPLPLVAGPIGMRTRMLATIPTARSATALTVPPNPASAAWTTAAAVAGQPHPSVQAPAAADFRTRTRANTDRLCATAERCFVDAFPPTGMSWVMLLHVGAFEPSRFAFNLMALVQSIDLQEPSRSERFPSMLRTCQRLCNRLTSPWQRWLDQPAARSRCRQSFARPRLELLEVRIVPAYNVAIGTTPTIDVSHTDVSNVRTFTAVADDAL